MNRVSSLHRLAAAALALALTLPAVACDAQTAAKPAPSPVLALGASAPAADVAMKGVDGKDHTIAGAKGKKGTLVIFSCNACPWVKAWESRLVDAGHAALAQGIGVIVVNPNDPSVQAEDGYDVMKRRAKARSMKFPYVVDATSNVARAFGATRTPEVFLFDAEGRLAYHGAIDDNAHEPEKVSERYLAAAVEAVAAGQSVPKAQTKALGCTIKWRKGATGA